MAPATIFLGVYFFVATFSLTVYLVTLWRLLHRSRHAGLIRTASCRVFAAILYETIGLISLSGKSASGMVTLGVFIIIQTTWWVNSLLDSRLTRPVGDATKSLT